MNTGQKGRGTADFADLADLCFASEGFSRPQDSLVLITGSKRA
jgi:hypothetical protein